MYIRKTDADINAEIAQELRAEAGVEREPRKAAGAAAIKQPARRKSRPVKMGKWTRWP